MKGRRNIPTKLKLLKGNLGKRKKDVEVVEPLPPPGIPNMPEWLRQYPIAISEWQREANILNAMGIITMAEESILANRCFLAHCIQETAEEIRQSNPPHNYSKIEATIRQHTSLGSFLGFDPTSRVKLAVAPDKKKSKFDGLISIK